MIEKIKKYPFRFLSNLVLIVVISFLMYSSALLIHTISPDVITDYNVLLDSDFNDPATKKDVIVGIRFFSLLWILLFFEVGIIFCLIGIMDIVPFKSQVKEIVEVMLDES